MFCKIPQELKFYPDKREKVKWKVPGLFEHDKLLLLLSDICEELKILQPIHVVFGGILSPWQAGRLPQIDSIDKKELYKIVEEYNKRNIACHLTFSNYRIKQNHLDDFIGNMSLQVFNDINSSKQFNVKNGIIISSDILFDYIRDKYPNVHLISSVIKPHYEFKNYDESSEYYNKLSEKFDNVCIRPEWNINKKFLKSLKNKDKMELMVNQSCFKKCPLARVHYDNTIKYSPNDTKAEERIKFCQAKLFDIKTVKEHLNNSSEQIDKMVELGFYNLKLKGRCVNAQALCNNIIGRYIFEPTGYFDIIQRYILHSLYKIYT